MFTQSYEKPTIYAYSSKFRKLSPQYVYILFQNLEVIPKSLHTPNEFGTYPHNVYILCHSFEVIPTICIHIVIKFGTYLHNMYSYTLIVISYPYSMSACSSKFWKMFFNHKTESVMELSHPCQSEFCLYSS